MEKTLSEIIEAVKNGERPDYDDLRNWWLFRRIDDDDDDRLEFVAEHQNFDSAYQQWADGGLRMFSPDMKVFLNVGEVIWMRMYIDGELDERDTPQEEA